MRTLIYKMTHIDDPDPVTGVWGRTGCRGQVRSYDFDAVIGVGGTSAWDGIAGRIVWIGIGPRKAGNPKEPLVAFDRFHFYGSRGPTLHSAATTCSMGSRPRMSTRPGWQRAGERAQRPGHR
jgi:hypothetical protein